MTHVVSDTARSHLRWCDAARLQSTVWATWTRVVPTGHTGISQRKQCEEPKHPLHATIQERLHGTTVDLLHYRSPCHPPSPRLCTAVAFVVISRLDSRFAARWLRRLVQPLSQRAQRAPGSELAARPTAPHPTASSHASTKPWMTPIRPSQKWATAPTATWATPRRWMSLRRHPLSRQVPAPRGVR